ncbi:MAG: hypothetical protein C5B59_00475 [Bacteroidetes bacterium]|nr:MAG: hypothetical protein C5B59_00475 [Bacteroidota bacterium]
MTTITKKEVQNEPFKKLRCRDTEVLSLPAPALKVWLYHYMREGQERESWPSVATICRVLHMGRKAVFKWRKYLVDNGWLAVIGQRDTSGRFSVPIMKVDKGLMNETRSGSDGRKLKTEYPTRGHGDESPSTQLGDAASTQVGDADQYPTRVQEVEPCLSRFKDVEPMSADVSPIEFFYRAVFRETGPQDIESDTSRPETGGSAALATECWFNDEDLTLLSKPVAEMTLAEALRTCEAEKFLIRCNKAEIAMLKQKNDSASKVRLAEERTVLRSTQVKLKQLEARVKEERTRLKAATKEVKAQGAAQAEARLPQVSPQAEAVGRVYCEVQDTKYVPAIGRLLEPMAAKYNIETCRQAFRFMLNHRFWGDKTHRFLAKEKDGTPWFEQLVKQCQREAAALPENPMGRVNEMVTMGEEI